MADDARITITLDAVTAERLAQAAAKAGVSPEAFAADMVSEQLSLDDAEAFDLPRGMLPSTPEEIARAVEEGREDFRQGRWVTHEEAMARLYTAIANARRDK